MTQGQWRRGKAMTEPMYRQRRMHWRRKETNPMGQGQWKRGKKKKVSRRRPWVMKKSLAMMDPRASLKKV
jgi:hypothetical protein